MKCIHRIIDCSPNRDNGLNLNQEDYLKAVDEGLWDNARILSTDSISNNKEVKEASKQANLRKAVGDEDVIADPAHIAFIKAIYNATAGASDPKGLLGEKVIAFGLNGDGQVIVKDIAIIPGQGGDIGAFIKNSNATAIAHLHYAGLESKPSSGDHSVPKFANIPNFTITHRFQRGRWKCCNLFEVGRVNNEFKFRSLKGDSPGRWKSNGDWK